MWLGEGITNTKQSTFSCWKWSNLSFSNHPFTFRNQKNPGCFITFIRAFIWKILKDGAKRRTTWEFIYTLENLAEISLWILDCNWCAQLWPNGTQKTTSQTLFWWKAAAFINITFVTIQAAKDKPKGNAVSWNKFWF